jgi:hypothetical protein
MAKNKNPREVHTDVQPDEPTFLLRGRDPQAADLVRLWAEGRDFLQGPDDPKVIAARQCADAMVQWCLRLGKNPVQALKLLPFELLAAELRQRGATVTPCAYDSDISEGEGMDS